MALPAIDPIDVTHVEKLSYVGGQTGDNAQRLEDIVRAVNGFVRGLPIADRVHADTQEAADLLEWPAQVTEGATMLAGRLWRRKDTPGGVAVLGDAGPVYVRRNDPDVALLLELGEHGMPAVG